MQWFDHSSTAASDDSMIALRMEHPDSAAVDLYWAIVEKQYRDEASVPFSKTNAETKSVLHRLLLGFEVGEKYVETMLELGLLKKDESGNVYSERAKTTIDDYLHKAEIARQNGKMGGRKTTRKPKEKPTQEPTSEPTRKPYNNTKQNNTGIGFDKTKPIPSNASGDAAAAGAAPPAAMYCPNCGALMDRTGLRKPGTERRIWRCPLCAEEVVE